MLAWQTKILLNVEPDVRRRMALVLVGSARERLADLLAAAVAGLTTVTVALIFPWLVGGATGPVGPGDRSVFAGVALGLWSHLLALPAVVALAALASRAITRSAGYGVAVLALGVVALVLGLSGSAAPWLVPPMMATARALTGTLAVFTGLLLTALGAGPGGGGTDGLHLAPPRPGLTGAARGDRGHPGGDLEVSGHVA